MKLRPMRLLAVAWCRALVVRRLRRRRRRRRRHRRPPAGRERRSEGDDHRVRRRVADRRVRRGRHRVRGRQPRRHGRVQLRRLVGAARADPRRAPGRRVRLGQHLEHGPGRRGGAAADPQTFVANQLQIAVPAGNPGGVTGLADFADADLLIGLCAEEVPCGQFGREALANAGVTPSIDTNEPDVRSLLTKVEAGELDAGIVYVTDVLSAGDAVEGIEIPADENVIATYPIAALDRRRQRARWPTRSSTSCCPTTARRSSRPTASTAHDPAACGREEDRGQGRTPWALVPLAAVAVAFVALPVRRPAAAGAVDRPRRPLGRPVVTDALRLSLTTAFAATGLSLRVRHPAGVGARPHPVPRPLRRPGARHPADGAAAGRRRRRAALRLRAPRPARRAGLRLDRVPAAVLDLGRRRRQHVRRHAVPRAHRRGRPPRPPTPATRTPPPPSAPAGGRSSGASPSPTPRRRSSPAPCCAGPGPSASSAPPSPSPATSRAAPRRMPLAVFLALESDRDAAIALSLVLIAVSLAVLLPLRDRWLAA